MPPAPTETYTLSLHDALPISHRLLDLRALHVDDRGFARHRDCFFQRADFQLAVHRRDEVSRELRSEEHTSELQSRGHLVCRLLLEKKKMADEMLIHTQSQPPV